MYRIAVLGIGAALAGDDGLGLVVIERLRERWSAHPKVLLGTLEGDLLAVADLLPQVAELIFVDAVAGTSVGEIVVAGETRRAFAPSLHQTDIAAVMSSLAAIGLVHPFPPWQVWGIVIEPPQELRPGLSSAVAAAVSRLADRLSSHLEELLDR